MVKEIKSLITNLSRHVDNRGMVVEIFRGDQVDLSTSGQVYLTTVNPGMNKGNHYHKRKIEWFAPLKGKALFILFKINTGEKTILELDGDNPLLIRVEPDTAHKFINNGNEVFYLLAFASELYNPEDADTYPYDPDQNSAEKR